LIVCALARFSDLWNLWMWRKPEYPERTTDHGQATGKLYHLQLRVECTIFFNLQSRAWTHAVLVIGLYKLLGNPWSPWYSWNIAESGIKTPKIKIIDRTICKGVIGLFHLQYFMKKFICAISPTFRRKILKTFLVFLFN
jgi:hypothetical protein